MEGTTDKRIHQPGESQSDGHRVACILERLVPAERLHWRCDPAELPFETTEEIEPLVGTIGQERAASAVAFALEMEPDGFNLFVAGLTGTGRTNTTRAFIEQIARTRPTPSDLCYVYHFKNPSCPLAIELPAGQRRPDGTWEPNSVNDRVDRRLCAYAERLKSFAQPLERRESLDRLPAEVGPRTPRVLRWFLRWSSRRR